MGDIFDQVAAQPQQASGDIFDQVAATPAPTAQKAAAPRSLLDRIANEPSDIPLDSYAHATERGFANIGQGVAQAIQGVGRVFNPKPQPGENAITSTPIGRMIRGLVSSGKQAADVPSAIHDINQTPDAASTYLKVAGDTAGQAAGQLIPAAVAHEAPGVPGDFAGMMPSKMRAAAGQLFQQVTAKAGDFPIDVEAPGKIAFDLKTQYQRGAGYTPPPVITRFLNRVTQPDAPPLTYAEARDFYSNASRLSADQAMKLNPKGKMLLGQFTQSLGDSIQQAANQAGVGAEHAQAMANYAKAMRYADNLERVRSAAVKTGAKAAVGAVGGAGAAAGYELYKEFSK